MKTLLGVLLVLTLTGCAESVAGRAVCGWMCGGAGLTLIDENRYKPEDKGRWPTYSACLGSTQGREALDACMLAKGYTREASK